MKKAIYTGIFCTILGLCINTPANASLISRGFLDQALTDYATTTALDLKADKADLTDLSNKIGKLPIGDIYPTKGLTVLLPNTEYYTYPTSIGDFMVQMFNGYLGLSSLADAVYYGNEITGQTDTRLKVKGLRQITDEIGTLPGGVLPITPGLEYLFNINIPPKYPTSLAELMTAIYGNSETGAKGLLSAIISGLPMDTDGDGQFDSVMGTLPNFNAARDAIYLANANTAKIGTLPTEYETVGAALSAIKGIAEEAKATALAAIPDPKTEGSNGKYVLTVDIIGDNATYRWEPIDRGNTTTTTE